ncbi:MULTISPECIES: SRPBCC family protein [unclassified Luteococcus]|uniref:SRPBCC family protein n=1 Tax=unclassified Luteococcus TaxID=2639923 RepID=UPI00313DDE14
MPKLIHTVQRVVNARPEVVFDLLVHPARHCEFDGSDTVRTAVTGPERLALGDDFGMGMSNKVNYTSSNRVVEFEEGRRIAWQTGLFRGDKRIFGGQIWRYELEGRGDGSTLVKETFDLTHARPAALLSRFVAPATESNMRKTLARLASLFER